MKKFLLIFCIILGISFFVTGCLPNIKETSTLEAIQKRDKLIVGVRHDFKPFGFKEGQKFKGYDVDLAKEMAKSILGDENKLELVEVDAANRIMALTSNEVDMLIAAITVNAQRKRILDFSTPYFMTGQALMIKKGTKIRSIADLDKKFVGVVLGTTSELNLRSFAPTAKVKGVKTYQELYDLINTNTVDVITADATILRGFEIDNPDLQLLSGRYTQDYYAIAVRKDDLSKSLLDKVNITLKTLKDSNFFDTLDRKWIKN